jgi:hypothetical protein
MTGIATSNAGPSTGWFADRAPSLVGVGSGYFEDAANLAVLTADTDWAIAATVGYDGIIFSGHTITAADPNFTTNGVKVNLPSSGFFAAKLRLFYGDFLSGHSHPQSRIRVNGQATDPVASTVQPLDGAGGEVIFMPRTAVTASGVYITAEAQGATVGDTGFFSIQLPSVFKVAWWPT